MTNKRNNIELEKRILELEQQALEFAREREQFANEQENLRAKLFNAIEMAHLGPWEYDVDSDLFIFNDQFYKMFRTSAEQVGGYTMHSAEYARRFVHPDDAPMVGEEIRRMLETTDPHFSRQLEHRIFYADGELGYISVRIFIQKNAKGRTVRSYGVNQDITERKRAEKTIRESMQKYQTLFEHSADGIFLHDLEGRILDVNCAALSQSGYTKKELLRMRIFDLLAENINPEEILQQWRYWKPAQPVIIEDCHRCKDGSYIAVEINTGRVRFGAEELMLAIVRDISERRQSENERQRLQDQLNQARKMESVGRLAGGVAHDFNNMLGIIIGHAELAMMQVPPTSSLYNDMAEIQKAAQRSANLTSQLLAFARKQTVSPKVLDLNHTIENIIMMLRRLIGEDIEMVWRPGADLWPIKIDPAQIDQILVNLCVNARDAISGGGKIIIETLNVEIDEAYCDKHAGCKPGNYAMLALSDDGCGMDSQMLDNLFEPFFTTKEFGKGTGLGLATVYGIIKQNEGYINVYSELGQGTSFKIYLPKSLEDLPAQLLKPDVTIERGTETILLVEDETAIRQLTDTVLCQYGYTVITASSPAEALATAEKGSSPIDLLITDVVMPGMNGKQLKEQIKKYLPDIKTLFMSGYTAEAVAHRGILAEDVHFLQKPFTPSALARKVRDVLDQA